MHTFADSRHFTKRIDPVSNQAYYVLSTRVAPIQQGFYFVNSCTSDDGRYFWFYCAFPPVSGHFLGVVDFLTDEVRWFPETHFEDASPMVDPLTGNVYWGCSQGFFMRTPHPGDKPVKIAPIPAEAGPGKFGYAATHLTFSPDRSEIFVDIGKGDRSTLGTIRVENGAFTVWYRTERGIPYNHAQFNPVDPDLALCAHEYHSDWFTGETTAPPLTEDGIYPRLHTISRSGVNTMYPPMVQYASHEWWSTDGKKIYYEDGERVMRTHIATGKQELAVDCTRFQDTSKVPVAVWHSHCTADERYFTADASYYSHGGLAWWRGCPSKVAFYNTVTDKHVDIVTLNPALEELWTPEHPCPYHIDPHPRFVLGDRWIAFTATVAGRVDAAVAEVAPLIEATR